MTGLGLFTLRVENADRLALSGSVIVANHPSLIDALLIVARARNVCCVAKPALFRNPCTAYVFRRAGYLQSDSADLIDDAAAAIRAGDNVLVFPEGTRNEDDTTLNFKRGAAHVALSTSCRIQPVTIDCHPRTLQRGDHWYDVPTTVPQIIVRALAPMDIDDHTDSDVPVTLAARRLTRSLRSVFVREARGFARFDDEPFPGNAMAGLTPPDSGLDGSVR